MRNSNKAINAPGTIAERDKLYSLKNLMFNFLVNCLVFCVIIITITLAVFGTLQGRANVDYTEDMAIAEQEVLKNINSYYGNDFSLPNWFLVLGYSSVKSRYIDTFGDYKRFSVPEIASLARDITLNNNSEKIINNHRYMTRMVKLTSAVDVPSAVVGITEKISMVKILYPIKEVNLIAVMPNSTKVMLSLGIVIGAAICSLLLAFLQVVRTHKKQMALNKFTSDISHELNTPLSIIQSNLQMLLDDTLLSDDITNKLMSSTAEVTRLRKMSKQLLTLSRCDNSRIVPEYKECNLRLMMDSMLEPYQMIAEMQDKIFEIRYLDSLPDMINIDKDLLVQILTALLDNAIKYTKEGEQIYVNFGTRQNSLEIVVGDTGAGVPENDLDKIFTRFYRTEESRTSEGTGLGLAIVHAIVIVLNGKILARNMKPKGFEVQLSLPTKTKRLK